LNDVLERDKTEVPKIISQCCQFILEHGELKLERRVEGGEGGEGGVGGRSEEEGRNRKRGEEEEGGEGVEDGRNGRGWMKEVEGKMEGGGGRRTKEGG
jgi:hypothetical protein